MLNIGGGELLIILLVALIFLGPERLPQVARQIGQTASSLRSLASGFQAEMKQAAQLDSASMTLEGPTAKADALKKTQTDPAKIAAAARQVGHDDEPDSTMKKSSGGPHDLRDEEE